jgi:hypothetical protein
MVRAVLYALLSIFLITIVRMFIGLIGKAMRDSLAESAAGGRPGPGSTPGRLKKCAVCGTYAPAAAGVKIRDVNDFVCSDSCASRYAA